MKTIRLFKILLLLGVLAVIASGCITSVHPLFTKKDLVFRPELIGTWKDNSGEIMKFSEKDSSYYSIRYISKDDTTQLIGRLGKLDEHYYLDITIDSNDEKINDIVGMYIFPVHIFFKVSLKNDQLVMHSFAFSSDWLEKLIKEKRIRIKHEVENDQVLLTASTEELQKFVIKYTNEPKAFDNNPTSYERIAAK